MEINFEFNGRQVTIEVEETPTKGFVMGYGPGTKHLKGHLWYGLIQEWDIAIVLGMSAQCHCDRCRGEYNGPDSNSYGAYGYQGCMSRLDSPSSTCKEEDESWTLLQEVYKNILKERNRPRPIRVETINPFPLSKIEGYNSSLASSDAVAIAKASREGDGTLLVCLRPSNAGYYFCRESDGAWLYGWEYRPAWKRVVEAINPYINHILARAVLGQEPVPADWIK